MTVYETLQLYFMAMVFGALVGFAWSMLYKWPKM